jgi:hypothetical protein
MLRLLLLLGKTLVLTLRVYPDEVARKKKGLLHSGIEP